MTELLSPKHLSFNGRLILDVKKLRSISAAVGVSKKARDLANAKLAIIDRDNGACVNCGSKDNLTIDHKIPVMTLIKQKYPMMDGDERYALSSVWRSDGRTLSLDNCQTLCADCHNKKDGNGYVHRGTNP